MSRVHAYTLGISRAAHLAEDSVEVWLVDQVWIIRKRKQVGNEDGTPIYTPQEMGPYAGRLTFAESSEQFQGDRWTGERRYQLVVQTDETPIDGDTVKVESRGVVKTFKITGGTISRISPARRLWVAHIEPVETTEI